MAEQSNAQAVQQVTEAQLYEILGRVYVSWQVASRERAAYFQAAQQNFQAYQKMKVERDRFETELIELEAGLTREKVCDKELSRACE